jgi:hypothetical protein
MMIERYVLYCIGDGNNNVIPKIDNVLHNSSEEGKEKVYNNGKGCSWSQNIVIIQSACVGINCNFGGALLVVNSAVVIHEKQY